MTTAMPALLMSCCIAVGFITATSLVLVNKVGESLYAFQCGNYKYRGDYADRKRRAVRNYSTTTFVMYSVIAGLLFFIASAPFANLLGIEKISLDIEETSAPWVMVVFSAAYIAYMLWSMGEFCLVLFNLISADEEARTKVDTKPPS